MGFFSLGGDRYNWKKWKKKDPKNHYYGMGKLLMRKRFKAEVDFLRELAEYKSITNEWFNFGRAMRYMPLRVNVSYSSDLPY